MILVTGATGTIGRHVVRGPAGAGPAVRTSSRSAGPHRGDLRDPDALAAALARPELLEARGGPDFVDGALAYRPTLVGQDEPVTDTVERITGRPARTFAEWATDHPADFR